ncbi:MAG: hypothetical protein RR539_08715 [Clostridium sp.]|uniref:hypothetical protein n=1 Tax=Clostridium sp. TaxID=1506 RepID=UPI002FC637AD
MKFHPLLRRKKKKKNYYFILGGVLFAAVICFLLPSIINGVKYSRVKSDDAFNRAMSMINHVWTYDKEKYVNINNNIVKPYYLLDSGMYIGIPYCYGGQTSLKDSNIKGISGFDDALSKGYMPGNINTNLGYIENTAGVDCSGFVNVVFNIKERTSTRTMDKYFKKININKLKAMDILNSKGKHVYIFLGRTKEGVIILESTSNGEARYKDKTVVNFKTNSEFERDIKERGYIPMRYKNIKFKKVESIYDNYEYNNKEKFAYNINIGDEINSSIEYLEDIDYYKILNRNTQLIINFSKFSNVSVVAYNKDKKFKLQGGENIINISGDIFIRVEKGENLSGNSDYTFRISR